MRRIQTTITQLSGVDFGVISARLRDLADKIDAGKVTVASFADNECLFLHEPADAGQGGDVGSAVHLVVQPTYA